jgi:phosphatidylserine synthase
MWKKKKKKKKTPVARYVPNILCYLRIILAFVGLESSSFVPLRAELIWIASASATLDLIDGPISNTRARIEAGNIFGYCRR